MPAINQVLCLGLDFFIRLLNTDVLVLLDHVQFPLGTSWINRNRLKNAEGFFWLTVPVWKKNRGKQPINKVEICNERNWQKKHYQSLFHAYKHAPHFKEHIDFFEKLYQKKWDRLLDLNLVILDYLLNVIGINKKPILSSSLNVNNKGTGLIIEICEKLNANCYVALSTSKSHIDIETFKNKGITIKFLHFKPPVYPQLWGDFLPNLSVVDLLLNCSPKALEIIKRSQK
ncbi:hypothetical protein DMNBHIDG_00630 [Candidatus Methanoperedenaceae archaeon GB37]|nr:hypothetical protein DMNBHIDG_00630 [Candidatus Methanoperedenaceae archaeon GB37]